MPRGQGSVASDIEDPFYVPGNWYMTLDGAVAAGAVMTVNSIRLSPFRLRQTVAIAQLGTRIATLAASGNIQAAIYAANRDTLLPAGTPLIQTDNISTTLAANVGAVPVAGPTQLPRGIYWWGFNADATAAGTAIFLSLAVGATNYQTLIGTPTLANIATSATNVALMRTFASTFGTWPNLTGQTTVEAVAALPVGMFQVAA